MKPVFQELNLRLIFTLRPEFSEVCSLRRGSLPTSWAPSLRMGRASRLEEAPLPRSSPRYPAELSQFPDGLLHEAFRKLFRSHATGGSIRRDSFINLA